MENQSWQTFRKAIGGGAGRVQGLEREKGLKRGNTKWQGILSEREKFDADDTHNYTEREIGQIEREKTQKLVCEGAIVFLSCSF